MNVTDVDDKIIARARRGVVLETYLKSGLGEDGKSYGSSPPSAAEVKRDASRAVALALERQELRLKRAQEAARAEKGGEGNKKTSSGDGSGAATTETGTGASTAVPAPHPPLDRRLAKELAESVSVEELKADQLRQASARLAALAPETGIPAILSAAGDVLAEHLDRDCGLGARVSSDPAIFRRHAARYEAEFLRDMEALRVRPPSVLTRVSEYMEGEKREVVFFLSFFFFACFPIFPSFFLSFLFRLFLFSHPLFLSSLSLLTRNRDRRLRRPDRRIRLRLRSFSFLLRRRRRSLRRLFRRRRVQGRGIPLRPPAPGGRRRGRPGRRGGGARCFLCSCPLSKRQQQRQQRKPHCRHLQALAR